VSPLSSKENCCFDSILALLADAIESINADVLTDIAKLLLKDNNRSTKDRHVLLQVVQHSSSELAKLRAHLSCILAAGPARINVQTAQLGSLGQELGQFLRIVAKEAVRSHS